MKFFVKFKKKLNKKYNKLERFFAPKFLSIILGNNSKEFPSATAGHYNLLIENLFYKVAIRQKNLFKAEERTIETIYANYPDIAYIIPKYEYKNLFKRCILFRKSEVLEPIEDETEQYQTASDFLRIFRKYSNQKKTTIDNMYNLKKGLDVIKYFAGEELFLKTAQKTEDFLQNNIFNIGFCHGDFHSKNLMKANGSKYLIDLDCIRENSIQELDAIYFVIQKIIDDTQDIWWFEACQLFSDIIEKNPKYRNFLQNFIDMNKIPLFMLIYFLDRIGQDSKYLSLIDELPKKDIVKTLNSFNIEE